MIFVFSRIKIDLINIDSNLRLSLIAFLRSGTERFVVADVNNKSYTISGHGFRGSSGLSWQVRRRGRKQEMWRAGD